MKPTKYRSCPCYFSPSLNRLSYQKEAKDSISFDSKLEAEIYRLLCCLIGRKNVQTQVPLPIKPPSKRYPKIDWRCDFRVLHPSNGNYLNVEAKGFLTCEFKRNVQYLELFSPQEYNRLLVIGGNTSFRRIDKNLSIWTIDSVTTYLQHWRL